MTENKTINISTDEGVCTCRVYRHDNRRNNFYCNEQAYNDADLTRWEAEFSDWSFEIDTPAFIDTATQNYVMHRLCDRLGDEIHNEAKCGFDCIAVTDVQVFPFKEGPSLGHLKALAQIVLNDQLVIRGLRVMEGEYGLFVSYPRDPFYKGEDFRSLVNPITRQLREHIENCVLEKYQAAIA